MFSSSQRLLQQHPCPPQPSFASAGRDAEDFRDLLVFEAFHVVEHENSPGIRGEPIDRLREIGLVALPCDWGGGASIWFLPVQNDFGSQSVQPGGERGTP